MSTDGKNTFGKEEHLCKQTLIERLFGGGAKATTAWPVRMVWLLVDKKDESDAPLQVLVSVSKRYFKRAVKRNRVKRQIREMFRHHKQELLPLMEQQAGKQLLVAFIWQADQLLASSKIEPKVEKLLHSLAHDLEEKQRQKPSQTADGL